MAGLHDIKLRIKSVKNTKQITKAMNLVATIKYKKAREWVEHIRIFQDRYRDLMEDIYSNSFDRIQSDYLPSREIKKTLAVVISADRGLCGAFNSAILRLASQRIAEKSASVLAIGLKAKDFFKKDQYKVVGSFLNVSDDITYHEARIIAESIIKLYQEKVVDEVVLYYNQFVSTIKYIPTEARLLPLTLERKDSSNRFVYEPSPQAMFDEYATEYIIDSIFAALLEASTSEQSSRMTAMSSATDNADNMIEELSMFYNRARQAAITNELSEIVGGTEALK